MSNRIICIGREFGSGGHEVAVRLSKRLGIRVYEKHLLYLACPLFLNAPTGPLQTERNSADILVHRFFPKGLRQTAGPGIRVVYWQ
ncbi:MAG: cytidylate kinase family protein [Candidatus Heritagella sp.]